MCAMPNLNPVPDSLEHLWPELDAIARDGRVRVYPYGAITRGEKGAELADMPSMEPFVCGFSDDGKGVQSADQMRDAMELAKQLDKPITAHCEDESLLTPGWCIHDGEWAKRNGFPGNAPESEWKQVERDLELVRETGCRYHVCHVSTKESVALIRKAKAEGLPVSCETGPHYLILCDEDLMDDGRFKMNPPIRSAADRDALIEGLLDGTIDCIATDHAPHSAEEKSRGLRSLNGIVGLECAFPVLYTELVEPGIVPFATLLNALCVPGTELDVLSGLGNGFDLAKGGAHPILLGGGIGIAPLYGLAQRMLEAGIAPTVGLGFRSGGDAFYLEEFGKLGCRLMVATEDGSLGTKGFVTDLARHVPECGYAFVCGPTPMLKAVHGLPQLTGGQFSFEARMGCGFGACMGCSVPTGNGYKRVCKDGLILYKEEIVW